MWPRLALSLWWFFCFSFLSAEMRPEPLCPAKFKFYMNLARQIRMLAKFKTKLFQSKSYLHLR